jgi:hypothetical protein
MSLATGDLTTLSTAKAYVEPQPSDAILGGLITRVSTMIRGYLNRPFLLPKIYSELYNGAGTSSLVLYNFPVIGTQLGDLVVSGATITLAPTPTPTNAVNSSPPLTAPFGYRINPWNGIPPGNNQVVNLIGAAYPQGYQNVAVTYTAGYEVVNEAATVPGGGGPYTVTPATPYGIWASDEGVTLDGVALTAVAGTPAAGQYQPPDPNATPTPRLVYTFNAAQAGAQVLLSYGYVPADLEQVALEVISERSSYRRRAGVRQQVLASQETIVYDQFKFGFNPWAQTALQAYCNVVPPPEGAFA